MSFLELDLTAARNWQPRMTRSKGKPLPHPIAPVAKVHTLSNLDFLLLLPFASHFILTSSTDTPPSCFSALDIAPTSNSVSTSKAFHDPCTAIFTVFSSMLILWLLTPILHARAVHAGNAKPPYPYDEAIDNGTFGYYPTSAFHTETEITAPKVNWLQWDERCNDGMYYFLTPKGWGLPRPGPMILDWRGDLIWSQHFANEWGGQAYDLMVQHYQGQDRLTFWTGDDTVRGHGSGKYMIVSAVLS